MENLAILYLYADRTGKKIVHYLLYLTNFHAVKCKYLFFVSSKRILKCLLLRAVVFYTNPRLCGKIECPWKKLLDNGLLQKVIRYLRSTI